jgi:oligopeptide/dipeptide ABC transporter ATP-binding protein
LGRAILGLVPLTRGSILFNGQDITRLSGRQRRGQAQNLQVVFQDPYSSLNPTRTIGWTLAEPLLIHGLASRDESYRRACQMLERVGLPPESTRRYPAQFSGGQRQRIAIARALMTSPQLVICDEPSSALDLSVQAQVLNLLTELQQDLSLSYLFIAHNLSVVRRMSHRIVVMYRGRIMESGHAKRVYDAPIHPYTRALLDAEPKANPRIQRERLTAAMLRVVPAPIPGSDKDEGCPYAARCRHAIDDCVRTRPPLVDANGGGQVACIRISDINPLRDLRTNCSQSMSGENA